MMKPDEQKREEGTDFARFAMNPVDVAEKADRIAAFRRTLKISGIVIAIVVAALGITAWARMAHRGGLHGLPLDQARDVTLRMAAEEFKQSLVSDVPGLAGRLEAVKFETAKDPGALRIRVDIKPAITDASGTTRPVGAPEVRAILEQASKQFVSFLRSQQAVEFDEAVVGAYMKGEWAGTARFDRITGETHVELEPRLGPG